MLIFALAGLCLFYHFKRFTRRDLLVFLWKSLQKNLITALTWIGLFENGPSDSLTYRYYRGTTIPYTPRLAHIAQKDVGRYVLYRINDGY